MSVTSPANLAPNVARWRFSAPARVFVIAGLVIAALPFINALLSLFNVWNLEPEYSHGMLIPPIALFLLWREREWLARTPFHGSWTGLLLVAFGLVMWLVGELATILTFTQYAFLVVMYGLVVALAGWKVFRRLSMPLLILIFMVPLPAFFSNTLSLQLQLLSSAIGVWLIRLFGISVFLEGNVIDLGTLQLQVAEACNGLRYLFPLMTLAFILAYFFKAPLWKRMLLFVASVPIAILMNSFRIGAIGITVEYWGRRMAEGLLHDFEGWVVFMFSTAALLGVAGILMRIGRSKTSLRDAFAFDFSSTAPASRGKDALPATARTVPHAFIAAAALAATASISAFTLPPRPDEATPARQPLVEFPNSVAEWQGRPQRLEDIYLDALKLDDYALSDYRRASSPLPVNLYVAYYESQRKGHSVHSPRSCIPGGGWVIRKFEQTTLPAGNGATIRANRVLIELGAQKQVMYYWFQQRGRVMTNEYVVKWYIFWDALTRNRTDGALVRLGAPVVAGVSEATVDAAIARFAAAAVPRLPTYIPN
jgi:exosortase D (VPLPA-CTERM-specific)